MHMWRSGLRVQGPAGRARRAPLPAWLTVLALGAWVLAGGVRAEESGTAGAASPPDAGATPVFDLSRCITTSLDQNYVIRKARERIRRQAGAVVEARAQFIPHLAANGSYQDVSEELAGNFGGAAAANVPISTETWLIGLQVTQSIYAGGGNRAALDRQRLLDEAAMHDLEGVINDVLLDVRTKYYAVLLGRSQINVQEQNVQLLQEELNSASNKLEAGIVSPFNVLRAEVALANGQTPLIRARNTYRLAVEDLYRSMGLSADGASGPALRPEVEGRLVFEPYTPDLTNELAVAAQQRAELRQLACIRAARKLAVTEARAGGRPDISVFAGYGAESDRSTDDTWDETDGWRAGVQGTWALFDGQQTRGRVMQAASEAELARLDEEQVRLDIDVEVRRTHAQVVDAAELVHATAKVVEQALESVRLARSRFDAGAATQLDVLQTQVALTEARNNEVQSLYAYQVALAQLRQAMGVLDQYVVEAAE
ncbi:MAG: TolC family protein [Lentisphaerae bacterium]|nr:TolC family protein [Lentisphaerota bacterium]